MLKKIKVLGDPNNKPFCSSEIIISSLNKGLKNIDLYSENGEICVYDCLGQTYGYNTNNIICPYETIIPNIVINHANNKRLIGVSTQNQLFFTEANYPKEKTEYCLLGVDSYFWTPQLREKSNKFIFGACGDSNSRSCYVELLTAFSKSFKGSKDIILYIKDRWATDIFKQYIKELSEQLDIVVIHDDEHITNKEKEREIYNSFDAHIFLNRSSTFALTCVQGMAMQKPTITMGYSGPRDYCNILNSALVDFSLKEITNQNLSSLVSFGYRNYLLPPDSRFFNKIPRWAIPNIENISEQLTKVYNNKEYRDNIAYQARVTSESMTWERSAVNLSYIVSK